MIDLGRRLKALARSSLTLLVDLLYRFAGGGALRHLLSASSQRVLRSPDPDDLTQWHRCVDQELVRVADEMRRRSAAAIPIPEAANRGREHPLETWIMDAGSPWRTIQVSPVAVPGMLSAEEKAYYEYIGSQYSGRGAVVELGPWLGLSTHHIVHGLAGNPAFFDRRLHVFDDFIWRPAWMNGYLPDGVVAPLGHASFRPLFEHYTHDIADRLEVVGGKLIDYDGNESQDTVCWDAGPVEMMYIDCGRTLAVNQAWFDIFSPSLIPDVSLLIMQDWRLHRERPRKFYNQTDLFTASMGDRLQLIHEVGSGGLATFLYRGAASR